MQIRALSRTLLLLILSGFAGCDNVIWGGADIQVVPPAPPRAATEIEPDTRAFGEFGLPSGPVVFHLVQGEDGFQLIPIAETTGEAFRPLRRPAGVAQEAYENRFRETVVPIGAQFEVFRRGARVGSFVAQANGPVTPCGVPTVTGNATVVAAAVDAGEYLAFRQGLAPEVRTEYSPPQITGPIRTYVAIVAERLILQAGLPRPRSWSGAQRDLQPIEIMPGGHPEMAATFLVGDALRVGPPEPDGYSVFYLADYETRRGYMPIYSEIRDYRRTGKAAPRLVDYVNVDGGETPEVFVQVYGRTQSWFDVLAMRDGEWRKITEGEPCE